MDSTLSGVKGLTKTHSKGDAYSKGGVSWKERAKSNHYGKRVAHLEILISSSKMSRDHLNLQMS